MKRRNFILTMIGCLALLIMLTVGLIACNSDKQKGGEEAYYLSLKSTGWQTYQAASDVPAGVLFAQKDGKFSVEATLEEGDELTVNKVGSSEKLGFDAVFSSSDRLVEGEQGNIRVAKTGAYTITLENGEITYAYAAVASSVQITAPAAILEKDGEYQFAAVVRMSDGSASDSVVWSSSAPEIASVSESGLVKALSVGAAKIKAAAAQDTSKYAEYDVEVTQGKISVTGVSVSPSTLLLDEEETYALTVDITPANATDRLINWSSSSATVAEVTQEGVVTALKPGTTTITARTRDGGHEASCIVTVRRPAETISSESALSVVANGKPRVLRATVRPTDATIISYKVNVIEGEDKIRLSKNEDGSYSVQGLAEGTATVEIVSDDNEEIKKTCTITILAEDSRLVALPSEVRLTINESKTVELEYDNAEITNVAWGSANLCTITDASEDGKFAFAVIGADFGVTTVSSTVTFSDGTTQNVSTRIYVTEEWYFIYGVGLSDKDWDYEDYLADRDKAKKDGRLLEETGIRTWTLTRLLTPTQSFQIIFPNVTSMTDSAGEWNKDIKDPATYYDAARSDDQYVSNLKDQFRVNTTGIYTITLSLASDAPKVRINLVSISVTNVLLSVPTGSYSVLKEGQQTYVDAKISPSNADYTTDDIHWSVSVDADDADYSKKEHVKVPSLGVDIEYYLNVDKTRMTISLSGAPSSSFALVIKCEVKGVEAEYSMPILTSSEQIVSVSSIQFDKDEYYLDVNNGGDEWALTVKAAVNDDATMQGILYTTDDDGISVDSVTGKVTAYRFGTFTVKATALGNSSKSDECTVTIYSDKYYLIGSINSELNWPEALPEAMTSIDGSVFADYALEDTGDHKLFKLSSMLTQGSEFQIAFLGMDANWTNAVTSDNFDADMSNFADIVLLNMTPVYTGMYDVYVDVSGKQLKTYVRLTKLLETDLEIVRMDGIGTLKKGDTFDVSVAYEPQNLLVLSEDDFKFSVDKEHEGWLGFEFDKATLTLTVSVLKAPESGVETVELSCKLNYLESKISVSVIADSESEVKPTSIAFEEDHYYYNVNNGGGQWAIQLQAHVNSEATNQNVIYSCSGASIDALTGAVIGTSLGTYTVTATAEGDANVTATTKVTFYSDVFYCLGEVGDLQSWASLDPSVTTLTSGVFYEYSFHMIDKTHFYIERKFEEMKVKPSNVGGYEYGFKVAYLGMDTSQQHILRVSPGYQSSTYFSVREGNMRVKVTGIYRIDIDLSDEKTSCTMQFKELAEQEVTLKADKKSLKRNDSATISLGVLPSWVEPVEENFSYSVPKEYSEYLQLDFSFENMTLTVTALNAMLEDEDLEIVLTVTYGDASGKLTLTILADHHLELDHDVSQHWYRCTDVGCDYEKDRASHSNGDVYAHDGMYHYYECSVCGEQSGKEAHFELGEDGWLDSDQLHCDKCGFDVFTFTENSNSITLYKYHGLYEKVRIPATYNGKPLTAIGAGCFQLCEEIKQVEMPATITEVRQQSFEYSGIQYITIKSGVTYGKNAYSNTNPISVTIEEGVRQIGLSLFSNCVIQEPVKLPDTLTTLDDHAFSSTDFKVKFGTGLTAINDYAMSGYRYELTLPDSLLYIGNGAFNGARFETLVIPDSVVEFGWWEGSKSGGALQSCHNLKTVVFGSGVRQLRPSDLNNCYALETIVFRCPSFHYIDRLSLNNLYSLKAVYYMGGLGTAQGVTNTYPYDNIDGREAYYTHFTMEKIAYYYSEVRPSEGTDFGKLAGAWHYDEEGNPISWADTPVSEDEKQADDSIKVYFEIRKGSWTTLTHLVLQTEEGVVDGNRTFSFNLTADDIDSWGYGKWANFTLTVEYGGKLEAYDENWTYSSVNMDLGTSGFSYKRQDYGYQLWREGSAASGTYTFTLIFNDKGLLDTLRIRQA